ncbi:MAG: glutathione S-transferase family protein [Gaiellaceae bacterium]
MYKLYVIPGSHACRSAMLMLDHKRVTYRRVDIVTLLHPLVARLHGFDAGGQTRKAGGRRTLGLRIGDRLGTVPALAANGRRISTNHGIARFLDDNHPEPPLFPADAEQRAAVEAAERWANETLQMAARRIPGVALVRDPAQLSRLSGDGRMGYLLYKRRLARRVIAPRILRGMFATDPASDPELLAELTQMLDRIDAWIADGALNGEQLNAADFMVAPSLALILYRPDVRHLFEGRPALNLVDRLLPDPREARARRLGAASTAGGPVSRPPAGRSGG